MKILIVENLKNGDADLEPYIPTPGQQALEKEKEFRCYVRDSVEVALTYLDKQTYSESKLEDLKIDHEATKKRILKALSISNWSQTDAAKLLGITPRSMNYYCGEFNISHSSWPGRRKKAELKILKRVANE